MPMESEVLQVGEVAPAFCLPEGLSGEEICLEELRGAKLFLMVMRGSW
jgi:peroxiredoxin